MTQDKTEHKHRIKEERWTLLQHVHSMTEKPMIVLSLLWIVLIILDYTEGLSRFLEDVSYAIWFAFVLDFIIQFAIAPHKLEFLRSHWLTAISLLLPAFRALRVFRILRLAWTAQAVGSFNLIRILGSVNRGMNAVRGAMGRRGVGPVAAITLIVLLVGAAGMLQFESPAALRAAGLQSAVDQGGGLKNYGEALWWTAMLMTSIGSEYWPKTAEGRLLCLLLATYALAVLGYITAAIASYFVGKDNADEVEARATVSSTVPSSGDLAELRAQAAALLARIDQMAAQRPPDTEPETA